MKAYIWTCLLLAAACLPLFGQEMIVSFTTDVTVQRLTGHPGGFRISLPEAQAVADRFSPDDIRPLFRHAAATLPGALKNLHVWRLSSAEQAAAAAEALQKLPEVTYTQPNYRRRIFALSNDPLLPQQWYLRNSRFTDAWQRTTGQPEVIVGVIDTGIDYRHEDLLGQLWINAAEDLNGNGRLDSLDLNGIDDDGNGYIDDVWGWDFTDAPAFPDGGDYHTPDNDPMDEYGSGHGTPIAGIIAAAADNGTGISGAAPGVRVMNLRAGNASGFLEEDDVAEAIVYAVENGCRIVNMSFGDVAYSYLLRDVIEYGVSKGVLFVASSGNSGNSEPNYPAAFSQTVSVGATDSTGQLAGFSSYGNSLNLVAPGADLLSTLIDNSYGGVNGTSFAAPLVSAAAALLWSQDQSLTREQVSGALFAAAEDLGFSGWDRFYGHGLLNAGSSLAIGGSGFAEITWPVDDQGISAAQVAVLGTVLSPAMAGFTLAYGLGDAPFELIELPVVQSGQILNDTLAIWQTGALPDTLITLELRLKQRGQPDIVFRTRVFLDRSAPKITGLEILPVIAGTNGGALMRFSTDDPTNATLRYRPRGSGIFSGMTRSRYFEKNHTFILKADTLQGAVEFYFELQNAAGLTAVDDNAGAFYPVNLTRSRPHEHFLTVQSLLSASGFLMPGSADFDGDGHPEIVFSALRPDHTFGELTVAQWQPAGWQLTTLTSFPAIPRDAGALRSGEGAGIVAGFGNNSLALGGNAPGALPTRVIWEDTTNFWVSRLQNYDDDPEPELFALNFGRWKIFDIEADFRLREQQALSPATPGNNQFGIPWSLLSDFDGDGRREIVLEDLDGDVTVFEANAVGSYIQTWSQRMEGEGGSSLLAAADVDGDGLPELVSAVRNQPAILRESNIESQYWSLSVWRNDGSDDYQPVARQRVLGVTAQPGVFNGLSAADVDGDGRAEILFTPFPRAYVLALENDSLVVRWYREGVNSNTVVTADVDGDGAGDVLVNTPEGLLHLKSAINPLWPPPPAGLTATPLDTSQVRLNWLPADGANRYRIYRKTAASGTFQRIDSVIVTTFTDSSLSNGQLYEYAITQVNTLFPVPESPFSRVAAVRPNSPPRVSGLDVVSQRQLRLTFSEVMGESAFDAANYLLLPEKVPPGSIVRGQNRREALLSFPSNMAEGQHMLCVRSLADAGGTPLADDSLCLHFQVERAQQPFYLKSAEILDKTRIQLTFNAVVDSLSAVQATYRLTPHVGIVEAEWQRNQPYVVMLAISGENRMGSLGQPYLLKIGGLRSAAGAVLDERGSTIELAGSSNDLENLVIYPNPYRLAESNQPLRFANLPDDCEIFIFTANGQWVRTLRERPTTGAIVWDLRNTAGEGVASGIYVYVVRWNGQEKTGKLLIMR